MVEIGCFLELQFLVLEQVPKDVTDASVHADLYSLVAVFYEFCIPHFYHALCNSLIINVFNILHREIAETRSNSLKLAET